jgi:hypothetical protein
MTKENRLCRNNKRAASTRHVVHERHTETHAPLLKLCVVDATAPRDAKTLYVAE